MRRTPSRDEIKAGVHSKVGQNVTSVRRLVGWAEARFPAVGVSLLLVVFAAACGGEKPTVPRERITVAAAMLPHASLVHVAAVNGYFAGAGLDVTVQPHAFGKLTLDALLAGKADLATAADTPIVLAILNGKPVSVVATIESASKNSAVVTRKESGIARPEDLSGKRVGRPPGTNAEFFLDTLLVRHGVAPESIHPVDLRPEEMFDALAAGRVDAVAIWNPYVVQIKRRFGDAVGVIHADDLYMETFNLVGRPDLVRDRAAAVEKFLRGLLEAETFFREHPEEARRRVASALAMEAADVDAIWEPFDFRVRLDQGLLVLLDDEARWAIRSGLAPKQPTPNFLDAMAFRPLQNAKPEAVRLIR